MAITIEGGITIGPGITMGDSGGGCGTIQSTSPRTINTTPAYLNANYNFTIDGGTDTWTIYDAANSIAWRISMIVGSSYVGNMISIERLV